MATTTPTPSSSEPIRCVERIPLLPSDQRLHGYSENLADIRDSESPRKTVLAFRNAHPVLRAFRLVYYEYTLHCWVLDLSSGPREWQGELPLYIGQRPVYPIHGAVEHGSAPDIVGPIDIDADTVMTMHDLRQIQQHFRHAYGVRVHRWGFIDVLFDSVKSVTKQRRFRPMPEQIGRLHFACLVCAHYPTASEASTTIQPSGSPSVPATILSSTPVTGGHQAGYAESCSIGLLVELKGEEYLTTVAHGWVAFAKKAREGASQKTVQKRKEKVQSTLGRPITKNPSASSRFARLVQFIISLHPFGKNKPDTPVGVQVYTQAEGVPLGEITICFDTLPRWTAGHRNHFPTAFQYDLALIEAPTGSVLPRMVVPSTHPQLDQRFALPEIAFTMERAFTIETVFLDEHDSRFQEHRRWANGNVSNIDREALISGADYFFDAEHIYRSLIWRTTPADDHRMETRSGSVLCVGRPTEARTQVVLFQNFQTTLSKKQYHLHSTDEKRNWKGLPIRVSYKGGFFLPTDFRNDAVIRVNRTIDMGTALSYEPSLGSSSSTLAARSSAE
ncbi:hypothetical protein B0H12DRAFT_1073137 [Mycena haematopus]|nr:hypothetical protein B0H12DRAFT_1073137 [Mycena haematopus]